MDVQDATRVTLEVLGVRLALEFDDPALMSILEPRLPPGWRPSDDDRGLTQFGLASTDGFHYEVTRDEVSLGTPAELDVAVAMLESAIRLEVAQRAEGVVFIHAGAVAIDGRALVIPGRSFSGKTTLVHELIGQGATYYSDEYALIDEHGLVHPYPKLLSIRARGAVQAPVPVPTDETHPAELGATIGEQPVRLALIAATRYVPGASWDPRELSPAEGALMLLSHAVTLRADPGLVLEFVSAATAGASALEGDRGEAAETAALLLDALAG